MTRIVGKRKDGTAVWIESSSPLKDILEALGLSVWKVQKNGKTKIQACQNYAHIEVSENV